MKKESTLIHKKGRVKLSYFLQELKNGHKVFDFEKIASMNSPINILITERGAKGKTFNIKEYLRKQFMKNGIPSIFIVNTKILAKKSAEDFLKDVSKPECRKEIGKVATHFWDNCYLQGSVDNNSMFLYHDKKPFIKIMGLSDAEKMKGARSKWANIVWEEFNLDWNRVRQPINKIESLIQTCYDPVMKNGKNFKLWVLGNFKTLNNMFLYNLGITSILHEVMETYDNKLRLVLTIVPKYTKKDIKLIEKENIHNWTYSLSKSMNLASHSFLNINSFDIINNIIKINPWNEKNNQIIFVVLHDKIYYNFWIISHNQYKLYIEITDSKWKKQDNLSFDSHLKVFHKKDVIEDSFLDIRKKEVLLMNFLNGKIGFESVVAREIFISSITK